ncbi:MAG: hypothetical protein A2201_00400, partial [Alicyclobacillus sp. RIFOXYA1_FULL_53_8]
MLSLDLQRFAGEKTEQATPQRRREVREEGRFPRSPDLNASVALVAILVALRMFGPTIWNKWQGMMAFDLTHASTQPLTQTALHGLFTQQMWLIVTLLAPILLVALTAAFLTAFAQVGVVFLPQQIVPDLNRISPIEGFKRMFSLRSAVDALKSLLKLTLIGAVVYQSIRTMVPKLQDLSTVGIQALPPLVGQLVFQIGIEVAVVMLILSIFDYAYQRYEFEKSIRMSRQEIKDESKKQEGDPLIKSKIRQRGRALAMRRMMEDVKRADVVITNPTHYAIALRYDNEVMNAPVLLAKG